MIVVFPFETDIYRRAGLDCEFVGHPLLDDLPETVRKSMRSIEDQKTYYGMNPKEPVIGLFPGSRPGEVSALLPHLISAAGEIRKEKPEAQFLLAVAPTLDLDDLRAQVGALSPSLASSLRWVAGDAYGALQASDAVIAASGTVTLQAAILLKPMVIVYKVSPLTFALARLLVRVDHMGLPNIVAGRRIVPELLQGEAHGERIAGEILRYLNDPEMTARVRRDLSEVRTKLGEPGASARAARIVLEHL
jgi:lipid-A-disaccharide synthase